MKKLVALFAILAVVVAAGCTAMHDKAYFPGADVEYWTDGDGNTTMVFTLNMNRVHNEEITTSVITIKMFADYSNVTLYQGTHYTYGEPGLFKRDMMPLFFFLWPEKYAQSSYAGSYFYGPWTVSSFSKGWWVKGSVGYTWFGIEIYPARSAKYNDWMKYK